MKLTYPKECQLYTPICMQHKLLYIDVKISNIESTGIIEFFHVGKQMRIESLQLERAQKMSKLQNIVSGCCKMLKILLHCVQTFLFHHFRLKRGNNFRVKVDRTSELCKAIFSTNKLCNVTKLCGLFQKI